MLDKLLAGMGSADEAAFAQNLQKAMGEQRFDPASLFTGDARFHALILAPFSPRLAEAVRQLVDQGTGPLGEVVEWLRQRGEADPLGRAQAIFGGAQGLVAVVCLDDQGLSVAQHLFHGGLDDDWCRQVAAGLRQDEALVRGAADDLRRRFESGRRWPLLIAPPPDARRFWADLARRLVEAHDQAMIRGAERVGDLPHWAARALADLAAAGPAATADELLAAARCHLLAGEIAEGSAAAAAWLASGGAVDEVAAVLCEHLAQAAVVAGQPDLGVAFFRDQAAALAAVLGGTYELALAHFRVLAAAMAGEADLAAGVEALKKADRKAFRHDLNREPLWRVTRADPGDLIDTAEAAGLINRSAQFVAKRLETATIPCVRDDGRLRIPRAGLLTWKAVMDRFALLD